MTPRSLDEWLDYQQRVHALGVDLGLARVREVWRRMGAPRIAPVVITVGGTNGKGSTVAFLEAMLAAAGKRVGCYTSPHLLRYNERVRVAGVDAGDAALIAAFERIEAARLAQADAPVTLTYFEFGTLAALWIFAQSRLDAAVLEVGLGGRLDAVNIVDADAAIVTTIALDHEDWLGNELDAIAREKAGIFRATRPAVVGDADAPAALAHSAGETGAAVFQAGHDYRFESTAQGWQWQTQGREIALSDPALAAPVQRSNAAAAIAALHVLRDRIAVDDTALAAGVRNARVAARLQRFVRLGMAELVIDVAHNPQAAEVLARWLEQTPARGRTLAVFGALADKDIAGIVAPLAARIDRWFVAGLDADTPRGLSARDLIARMDAAVAPQQPEALTDITAALDAAVAEARPQDRVLAFGSFHVAAPALAWAARNGFTAAT
ncbi:bifunctional tetrahydrofolate synthase/dihydrofolate synthase [Rudaea sp.]|uniref:bifunctional tetrahydrofolate synthase/dihydrofolate synthase n=1 Tax=Rudaea sp. TaxID=2136325 RepID=UPI002ED66871